MRATERRPVQDTPPLHPVARLTDNHILEIVEPVYEWACWASDLGMVDFDTFAELSRVIHELRLRAETAT